MLLYYAQVMHTDKHNGLYDKEDKQLHRVLFKRYLNKEKTECTPCGVNTKSCLTLCTGTLCMLLVPVLAFAFACG